MTPPTLEHVFKILELSSFDASVYWELWSSSDQNITKIARMLDTNRVRVYSSIKRLELCGVAQSAPGYIELLSPAGVKELVQTKLGSSKQQLKQFEKDLPSLLHHIQPPRVHIIQYDDMYAMGDSFMQLQESVGEGGEMWTIGFQRRFYSFFTLDYCKSVLDVHRERLNIGSYIITDPANDLLFDYKASSAQASGIMYKKDPHQVQNTSPITVIGDTNITWDLDNGRAIQITDSGMSNNLRSMIQTVWNTNTALV